MFPDDCAEAVEAVEETGRGEASGAAEDGDEMEVGEGEAEEELEVCVRLDADCECCNCAGGATTGTEPAAGSVLC